MSDLNFDDLEVPLDSLPTKADKRNTIVWTNPCPKCGGTGSWRGRGTCFMCKGSGKLSFKTSPESREKARNYAANRKVKTANENLAAFAEAEPAAWKWIVAKSPTFDFAASMRDAVAKYGHLTERQLAAVGRMIEGDAQRAAQRAQKAESAAQLDVAGIAKVFENARNAKLKQPCLRVGTLELELAKEHSRNPGAIYAKDVSTGAYLGKIVDGRYMPTREATSEHFKLLEETARDPVGLALAYGKRTGRCACCGLTLTNPESIERGIGLICAGKWFGA